MAALLALAVVGCKVTTGTRATPLGVSVESTEASEGTQVAMLDEGTGESTSPPTTVVHADYGTDLDMDAISDMVIHISTKIGPRPAGSKGLRRTARWIRAELADLDYDAEITEFTLPGEMTGMNVTAATPADGPRLVLAAHMDTVRDCPCANDDASGIASMIEILRLVKERGLDTEIPLQLVFLGAEEEIEGFEGHGYSAIKLMEQMPEAERARMGAAIWLDKLGRGPDFLALVIEGTDNSASEMVLDALGDGEPKPEVKTVPRWSEEMAFEDAGIPTVWLEWAKDRHLHKSTDTWESIEWDHVAAAADATLKVALAKAWVDAE